jgi:NAD(P)-dependent dehydrogenase (short-subunit alcohol dehydrogenase family)
MALSAMNYNSKMNGLVFITGASSGLGKATALEYARRGMRVIVGVRKPSDGEALRQINGDLVPVLTDLANPASIDRAAKEVDDITGSEGLSILVNTAGYAFYAPIEHTAAGDVHRLFQVLTFGPASLANALLPSLARRAAGSGSRSKILNIISWAAIDASPFVGYYSAAKAALLRLTQAQMYEFDRFGIDASAIVPGLMKTPFVARVGAQIAETLASLPLEGIKSYGTQLQQMAEMSMAAQRNPLVAAPESVARHIVTISSRARLRSQYNLGIDTALVEFMNRFVPFCMLRRMKVTLFGLDANLSPLPAV